MRMNPKSLWRGCNAQGTEHSLQNDHFTSQQQRTQRAAQVPAGLAHAVHDVRS